MQKARVLECRKGKDKIEFNVETGKGLGWGKRGGNAQSGGWGMLYAGLR